MTKVNVTNLTRALRTVNAKVAVADGKTVSKRVTIPAGKTVECDLIETPSITGSIKAGKLNVERAKEPEAKAVEKEAAKKVATPPPPPPAGQ